MDIITSPHVRGGKEPQLRYIALRLAGLDLRLAAKGAGLRSIAMAKALECLFEGNLDMKLLAQLQLRKDGGGKVGLCRRLHLPAASVLAERLLALSPAEVHRLAETLRPDTTRRRRSKRRPAEPPLDAAELSARLRVLAATLPLEFALLVQARDGYYGNEDLARLRAVGARVAIGEPVRRLGDRPSVSIVRAGEPDNRFLHGRLSAYVRCMFAAAQLIHSLRQGTPE